MTHDPFDGIGYRNQRHTDWSGIVMIIAILGAAMIMWSVSSWWAA